MTNPKGVMQSLYTIEFKAKRLGAIGISQKFIEIVESDTEENAILKLYDTYEHIERPYITEVKPV